MRHLASSGRLSLLSLVLAACRCDGSSTEPNGQLDLSVGELQLLHDASLVALSRRRIAAGDYYLWPPISDDYVAAFRRNVGMSAVSLSGAPERRIATGLGELWISHPSIFVWPDGGASGPLFHWSPSGVSRQLAVKSLIWQAKSSSSGEEVIYADRFDTSTHQADLVIARPQESASFHFARVRVDEDCIPGLAFVDRVGVALFCPAEVDAGTAALDLVTVNSTTGAMTLLKRGLAAFPFWVDAATRRALVADTDRRGWLVSIEDGSAVPVADDVLQGYIVPASPDVVFLATGGRVMRSTAEGVKLLVPGGASGLLLGHQRGLGDQLDQMIAIPALTPPMLSARGDYVSYFGESQSQFGFYQLGVASTVEPGKYSVLEDDTGGWPLGFDEVTSDFYFLSNARVRRTSLGGPAPVGDLQVRSTTGEVATISQGSTFAYPAAGSKVVFSANYRDGGRGYGRADIFIADHAALDRPMLVASGAEVMFFVSTDGTKVVYSITESDDAGVYVYDIP